MLDPSMLLLLRVNRISRTAQCAVRRCLVRCRCIGRCDNQALRTHTLTPARPCRVHACSDFESAIAAAAANKGEDQFGLIVKAAAGRRDILRMVEESRPR